jgi:hypothetical protein
MSNNLKIEGFVQDITQFRKGNAQILILNSPSVGISAVLPKNLNFGLISVGDKVVAEFITKPHHQSRVVNVEITKIEKIPFSEQVKELM